MRACFAVVKRFLGLLCFCCLSQNVFVIFVYIPLVLLSCFLAVFFFPSNNLLYFLQFFEAAKVEGHAQAPALAAMGRYFQQMENRSDAAEKCFKKALAIDPSVDIAGTQRTSMDSVGREE